jgi:acetyl-CoA carboxylase biotin carboxyl carrier protein
VTDTPLVGLCVAVERLLRSADVPPARLRVSLDGAAVELEWSERPGPPAGGASSQAAEAEDDSGVFHVCAPMVGTFYHAPEPDADPFVRVGDLVGAGQQVGVLEAMKLFNPVEAERPGRVVEILVANASTVEYGQPLLACAAPDA